MPPRPTSPTRSGSSRRRSRGRCRPDRPPREPLVGRTLELCAGGAPAVLEWSERTPSARATTAGSACHVAVTTTPAEGTVNWVDDPCARLGARAGDARKGRAGTTRSAAGARAVGGQRRHQDRLGPPDRVGRAPLGRARLTEVDRVAVEADAGRRIGGEVEDRPRRRHDEPVAVVADHRGASAARSRGAGPRGRRAGRNRGREQHRQSQHRESESHSESGQSTHPHASWAPATTQLNNHARRTSELPGSVMLPTSARSRKTEPSGGGGIRTRGPLARTLVFKTSAFDRSATPPGVGEHDASPPHARLEAPSASTLPRALSPGEVAEWLKALAC